MDNNLNGAFDCYAELAIAEEEFGYFRGEDRDEIATKEAPPGAAHANGSKFGGIGWVFV